MGDEDSCVDSEDAFLKLSELKLMSEPGQTLHRAPCHLKKAVLYPHHLGARGAKLFFHEATHRLGTWEAVTVAEPVSVRYPFTLPCHQDRGSREATC